MNKGITYALLAAVLFGISTPFAKVLAGEYEPVLLAGLLYAGSGIGLSAWLVLRKAIAKPGNSVSRLGIPDFPWLAGAILSGGVLAPVLMMSGLSHASASSSSLLLNMEGVLTALLAWFVFREQFDRRIFLGMMLIIAGGVLLSWQSDPMLGQVHESWGALAVVAACLCWAIDNNLTRKVSTGDAVQIAALKGLVSGAVNLSFALLWLGAPVPAWKSVASAGILGFGGYGLSLVLFVLALRHLGTARTGAYFSAAPFVGAAVSLLVLGEQPDRIFWFAAALMGCGIWLHITESHDHLHRHDHMEHAHTHTHDAHHQHAHDFAWDGKEPHSHSHVHQPMEHAHPHFPDIHHRHTH
ncbi:DMT family transporter [Noviherbaspirillum saxi]|uniref:DMT family transporter n=1 Tax=Noviherbaspirillum saxi TaxID=2320863 RepID=A0A3A3FR63_9BURK|nr:DMT family transporter [Noviherbaspirillum saxi]RJF98333.1 DMT family transporter [Noviherbaspirillum saxi]